MIQFKTANSISISMQHGTHNTHAEESILLHQEEVQGELQTVEEYERGYLMQQGELFSLFQVRQTASRQSQAHLNQVYLAKCMPIHTQLHLSFFQRNIGLLNALNGHSCFLRMQDHWLSPASHSGYIVLENCRKGSLYELLQYRTSIKKPLPVEQIILILGQILRIVDVLHGLGIVHHDIKPSNLFFDDQLNLKLGGFELASWGSEELGGWQRGTPYFKGPEKWIPLVGGAKPKAVDIWSVGIISYMMMYLKHPFLSQQECSSLPIGKQLSLLSGRVKVDAIGYVKPKDANYDGLITLVSKMVSKLPRFRPQANSLLKERIFQRSESESVRKTMFKQNLRHFRDKMLPQHHWKQLAQKELLATDQSHRKNSIISAVHLQDFGFFFLLSNLEVIAYFNDHSTLRRENEDKTTPSTQSTASSTHSQKDNKVKILEFVYQRQFQLRVKGKEGRVQENGMDIPEQTSIFKLFWHQNTLFVRLSNQTIQVFFREETAASDALFGTWLTMNNSQLNPAETVFTHLRQQHRYQDYQTALGSQLCRPYADHVRHIMTLLRNNSQVESLVSPCSSKIPSITQVHCSSLIPL